MLRQFFSRKNYSPFLSTAHRFLLSVSRCLLVPPRKLPRFPREEEEERLSFRTGSGRERKVLSAISQHHRSRYRRDHDAATFHHILSFERGIFRPQNIFSSIFFSIFFPPERNLGHWIELVNVRGNANLCLSTLVPELSWLRFKM